MGVGLYLHIPFCKRKCGYCDFCSYAGREAFWLPVVAGMKQEICFAHGLDVDTIYFGGGTPTLLPAALLRELMREIYKNLHVAQGAEISMEANPGTVDREKLDALREMGVNRLSIVRRRCRIRCWKRWGAFIAGATWRRPCAVRRRPGLTTSISI